MSTSAKHGRKLLHTALGPRMHGFSRGGPHLSVTGLDSEAAVRTGRRRERRRSSRDHSGGGGEEMGLGGRGVVGERWSQRVLWLCAIGSAVSLYYVAVERQAQNRARAMAEGLKALDGAGAGAGEDV
uniref:Uncharacterized protein n=1 Tax=Oryza brachyantha TaxID=4533 RepID=J3LAK2_ORYBR